MALWLCLGLVFARGVGDILDDSESPLEAAPPMSASAWPDDRAGAFAAEFAQAYLSTRAGDESLRSRRLARMAIPELDGRLAAMPPQRGNGASVVQATVAGSVRVTADRALVTVASVLRGGDVRHLIVPIGRDTDGGLAVVDVPSFGPPPPLARLTSNEPESLPTEDADALSRLSRTFLGAYLSGDAARLAYLVAPGSHVAVTKSLTLVQITEIGQLDPQAGSRRRLQVEARVRDRSTGAVYAAAFWLDVIRRGRWYVTRIAGGGER